MTTRTRALRSLAVYAAGFLPFALFWRSIGFVPSVLIGVIAVLVVAFVFRRHDQKSRAARELDHSTERGK
ncbi:putative secreted protein with PEP-CTERM sorting signal [Arthrobacter sp. AG258]|nr:putative secreted protein with PEP-CTERM sorting signal [Arthrobacter sp. AG258]